MDNKKLIAQYIRIGIPIPEYQLRQLSKNDLGGYFKQRFYAHDTYLSGGGDEEN